MTFSIPTLNSAEHLERCLKSIRRQGDHTIIVVDGGSTDDTIRIARKYTHIIFRNEKVLADYGAQIAARHTDDDLFVIFAADNELTDGWCEGMERIFQDNPYLCAAWCKMVASPDDPPIMRYYELIQSEPLAWFINTDHRTGVFVADRALCWGANGLVYNFKKVRHLFNWTKYTGDNEIFQQMVTEGNDIVGYFPYLHIYHHTRKSVWDWIVKWNRNYKTFLSTKHERNIGWLYQENFRLKIFLWLIYSLTPLCLIDSVWNAFRDRNIYWMYHPLMSFLQTVLFGYWTIKEKIWKSR